MKFHISRTIAGFTAIIGLILPAVQAQNLLTNGSFETGTTNFEFTNQPASQLITAGTAGEWISRENGFNANWGLPDISSTDFGSISGQDGTRSMAFQLEAKRAIVQYVDMTGTDLNGQEVLFSTDVVGRGLSTSTDDVVKAEFIGFNNPIDVNVNLGGSWDFDAGTFDSLGSTILTGAAIDESNNGGAMSNISLSSGTLSTDYDYLAVLIGGQNVAQNSSAQYVAFDDVSLTVIPEPSTFALLGLAGLAALAFRRRRK